MSDDKKTVIFDIDDVLMPWAEKVHQACIAAGLAKEGSTWTNWSMWEDYGCTKEAWLEVVNGLVIPGGIYHAPPYPGAAEAVRDVTRHGHTVHLVTARGFFDHAEQIRAWTVDWIYEFRIPGHLWFSRDKGRVAEQVKATHSIDDNVENAFNMMQAGTDSYLLNQPHNASAGWDPSRRVDSVAEFVERILDNE